MLYIPALFRCALFSLLRGFRLPMPLIWYTDNKSISLSALRVVVDVQIFSNYEMVALECTVHSVARPAHAKTAPGH